VTSIALLSILICFEFALIIEFSLDCTNVTLTDLICLVLD